MTFPSKFMIIIYGPTGVGKSDFAELLAHQFPTEIVNLDMGQFYTPLTIGTAKPDWRSSSIVHHLFDIIDTPTDLTVTMYREMLAATMESIWAQGKIPVIVGGSGFYLKSIFFPPIIAPTTAQGTVDYHSMDTAQARLLLESIDPVRAEQIHTHDRYRLMRALDIWYSSNIKPSESVPVYDPPASALLICVSRDRKELYRRIDERVLLMLKEGWIDEVRALMGTAWQDYLMRKKIIGYNEIIVYLQGSQTDTDYQTMVAEIQQRCRNYAKRQYTFWRMLKKQLETAMHADNQQKYTVEAEMLDLTLSSPDLYIKQLSDILKKRIQ